ncbi:YfbM family protein [Archangium violaceum]|uniref:YfbM family protein n=1 Tax=Archangium violaceum TaxID=83451 RepID=UPI0019519828|nr:YfbM family protein [Archangium violaceum]QRN98331.1 YfbM family protein [Archangium violaceum]
MSMIIIFRLARRERLSSLLASPEQVTDFLHDTDGEDADGPENRFDLDKAWHGLHFLLTGTDWGGKPPLNFIAVGGETIGDVDVGYGPARAFTPEQLAEISRALDAVSSDALRQRFDPAKMMELDIYPSIWDRDPADDDTLGYVLEYFEMLKSFLRKGAERGLGVVVYMS